MDDAGAGIGGDVGVGQHAEGSPEREIRGGGGGSGREREYVCVRERVCEREIERVCER